MATKVTIELSDTLYRRTQRLARLQQQDVAEAISTFLDQSLPQEASAEEMLALVEDDPEMARELAAYIELHPMLKKKYLGKYVAIYQGELVDYDDNSIDLEERIDAKYPDVFVWMGPVKEEPIETILIRSPRLMHD